MHYFPNFFKNPQDKPTIDEWEEFGDLIEFGF